METTSLGKVFENIIKIKYLHKCSFVILLFMIPKGKILYIFMWMLKEIKLNEDKKR